MSKEYVFNVSGGLVALGIGARELTDSLMKAGSIRDAVYYHADKITPEVIKQANTLADKIDITFLIGLLSTGIGGILLSKVYSSKK